ncbi:MAG: DnaJ domain-containing protein [Anaerolineales bacterium]|nr:DnaJ domain-containing protein [Chloroflexota bacterium]MBL7163677.1 DnaJ domain-containing protein [Anaerolineales bacterium]
MSNTPSPQQEHREQRAGARKPNLTSSDPYAVLGLPRRTSSREVKRAYFKLVRQYPPETHADFFKLIRAAYEKLQTEETKAETDLFLFQPPPPWEARKRRRKLDLSFDAQDIWLLLKSHGDLGRVDFQDDYRAVKI